MFVLSPLVAAMKASAFSIPAASRASVSSPVPTVKRPPRSSQPFSTPTSSRVWDARPSSRQETSWPSPNIERATEEPTRPQPTIRMNMSRILDGGSRGRTGPSRSRTQGAWRALHASDRGRRYALVRCVLGRGREQDLAGRLLQHVLGRGADLGRLCGAYPPQRRATADLARRLGPDHDRFDAAPSRRLDYPGTHLTRPCHRGGHFHVLVL